MLDYNELGFDKVDNALDELQKKRESVLAGIEERHKELNEAIKRLDSISQTKSDNSSKIAEINARLDALL